MSTGILTSLDYSHTGVDSDGYLKTTLLGVKAPTLYLGVDGSEANAGSVIDQSVNATLIGAPAGTGVACTITRVGKRFELDFTFTSVAVTHTDAGGSGSSGSIKIFDFAQGGIIIQGSRSNLTFLGDALIDTNAGDMAFKYGFGSVAADAGDGALTGTEVDFAAISGTITLSAKAASSATLQAGAGATIDGTATAADLYFNESGTAATSDANGVLTFSGTATFVGTLLGDD